MAVINVTYTYICSACGKKHEETHCIRLGEIPKPCIPYGWNMLNHSLFCTDHTITVVNDKIPSEHENGGIDGDV